MTSHNDSFEEIVRSNERPTVPQGNGEADNKQTDNEDPKEFGLYAGN